MKKIFILTVIAITIITNINYANAGDTVTVYVTEKVPGVECTEIKAETETDSETGLENPSTRKCEIAKGSDQIVSTLGSIIKYFTYLATLFGVLFIVGNGIMYSMGGADQSLKDEAKKRIQGTLLGLIVLLLSGPILQFIAPWIYK